MKNIKTIALMLVCLSLLAGMTACRRPDPSEIPHDWGEWRTIVTPSCEKEGMRERICLGCKKTEQEPVAALGHDFSIRFSEEPSCLYEGYAEYACSRCNFSYVETIAALGHDYQIVSIDEPQTCNQIGAAVYECTRCSHQYTEALTLDHEYDDAWQADESSHWKICLLCGNESDREAHSFDGDFCTVCGYRRLTAQTQKTRKF